MTLGSRIYGSLLALLTAIGVGIFEQSYGLAVITFCVMLSVYILVQFSKNYD